MTATTSASMTAPLTAGRLRVPCQGPKGRFRHCGVVDGDATRPARSTTGRCKAKAPDRRPHVVSLTRTKWGWTVTVYGIDRDETLAHRSLISRYGALRARSSSQAHRRGQEFNALVADVLRYWGVEDVEDGVRGLDGSDEIDVAFSLGGTPYLLEAKWHARPISDYPTAKLLRRIRRRLGGTRGIVLSMSGFTGQALESADRGDQPEVLLLDRSHFEAMLSGLLPPQDLLAALVRLVARHGGVQAPLTTLLGIHLSSVPEFVAVPPAEPPWDIIRETAGGINAQAVFLGGPGWPEPGGVGAGHGNDLLITSPAGIIRVAVDDGSTRWALPLAGCRGTPVAEPDGGLLTICNYAAVRWNSDVLEVLGGGFTGNSTLLAGPDGQTWVSTTPVQVPACSP